MIEGDFDRWTLANMNAALDEACRNIPRGEEHAVRRRIARHIIKSAKSGRTTLEELTAAGQRALMAVAASRNKRSARDQPEYREDGARSA